MRIKVSSRRAETGSRLQHEKETSLELARSRGVNQQCLLSRLCPERDEVFQFGKLLEKKKGTSEMTFDTSSSCFEGKRQDHNAKYAHSDDVSPRGICKAIQMASVDTRLAAGAAQS